MNSAKEFSEQFEGSTWSLPNKTRVCGGKSRQKVHPAKSLSQVFLWSFSVPKISGVGKLTRSSLHGVSKRDVEGPNLPIFEAILSLKRPLPAKSPLL